MIKYWIEKSLITGMPIKVEKCDFRPTLHSHLNTEFIETREVDPEWDALVDEMVVKLSNLKGRRWDYDITNPSAFQVYRGEVLNLLAKLEALNLRRSEASRNKGKK